MLNPGWLLVYLILGFTTVLNILIPVSGSSIVTPLLALLTSPQRAIAIASAFFVLSGLVRTVLFRKQIQWKEVHILWFPSVLAAGIGALAIITLPERWLLGVILLFSAYFLAKKLKLVPATKPSKFFNHFVGVVSGFLQGTGLAGSDLRNQYLYAEGLEIAEVHGTTSFIGTSNFLIATFVRLYLGQVNLGELTPLVYLFPLVVFAIWLGRYVLYKVPKKFADGIILTVMFVVVFSLIYKILFI